METEPEIACLTAEQSVGLYQDTVAAFRSFFGDAGAEEIPPRSLIAHHDPTLRFTNSTTSVMKSYIRGTDPLPCDGVVLAQPAMGSQGIGYWLRDGSLGPFASYFTSLGVLLPPITNHPLLRSLTDLLLKGWHYKAADLRVTTYANDTHLAGLAHSMTLPVLEQSHSDDFRHVYGMDGVSGENINIQTRMPDATWRDIGNLTLIRSQDTDVAYEVSFDSSPVIAGRAHLTHAMAGSVTASVLSGGGSVPRDLLVASDCLAVMNALALEGLEPTSKGKAGLMRKFAKEYVRLTARADVSSVDSVQLALEGLDLELRAREALADEDERDRIDSMNGRQIIYRWIPELDQQVRQAAESHAS